MERQVCHGNVTLGESELHTNHAIALLPKQSHITWQERMDASQH